MVRTAGESAPLVGAAVYQAQTLRLALRAPALRPLHIIGAMLSTAEIPAQPLGATGRETQLPGTSSLTVLRLPLGVVGAMRRTAGEWGGQIPASRLAA